MRWLIDLIRLLSISSSSADDYDDLEGTSATTNYYMYLTAVRVGPSPFRTISLVTIRDYAIDFQSHCYQTSHFTSSHLPSPSASPWAHSTTYSAPPPWP